MATTPSDPSPLPRTPPWRVPSAPANPAGETAARQSRRDQSRRFDLREVAEMRRERATLFLKALAWAPAGALPFALLGAGLACTPAFPWPGTGWTPPGALVGLLLGAACGAVGGATAGLLVHSLFEEERDIPIVVLGVMTTTVLCGAVGGAGAGGLVPLLAGVGLSVPAGLAAGIGVLMVYSALRWVYRFARGELPGE